MAEAMKLTDDPVLASLRWEGLCELLEEGYLTDVTIKVAGNEIHAHRIVLASVSQFFKESFTSREVTKLDLSHLDPSVVQDVIKYMYSGNIEIELKDMSKLIEVCESLQLNFLKRHCDTFIAGNISITNCLLHHRMGTQHDLPQVLTKSKDVTNNNFLSVSCSDDFLKLSCKELTTLLQWDELKIKNEDPVLKACFDWVEHDIDSRRQQFPAILEHVRITFCSNVYMKSLSPQHQLLLPAGVHARFISGSSDVMSTTKLNTKPRKSFIITKQQLVVFSNNIPNKGLCYNEETLQWQDFFEPKPPSHIGLASTGMLANHHGIMSVGGYSTSTNQCIRFNFQCNCWVSMNKLPSARHRCGVALIENVLFVIGGHDGEKRVDSVDALHIELGQWSSCKPMLHPMSLPIVVSHGPEIYVLMNTEWVDPSVKAQHGVTLQVYDSIRDRWQFKSNLPDGVTNTWGASALVVRDVIYLIGGKARIFCKYDVTEDHWTILENKPVMQHFYGSAALYNNRLLLIGGEDTNTVEEYDCGKEEWKECAEMKLPGHYKYIKAGIREVPK